MSEPTPEQRRKTILLARQIMANMMLEYADDIREHQENLRYLTARTVRPEPQEDPQEQARLKTLLAEVKNSGEKK